MDDQELIRTPGAFDAIAESRSFIRAAVKEQRVEPGDGLLGMIIREHGDGIDDEELAGLADGVFTGGYETTAAMLEALGRLDLRSSLPRIEVPTLVVHGGADRRSPFTAALAIAQAIPHARLVELAGLGHDCCGEAEFIRALERFLDELGAQQAA